jgi:hypothetical protein
LQIPSAAIIPIEKLTAYLLVPRRKNDKSQFLARAGFTAINPIALELAIRQLIAENEAIQDRQDEYGTFYQVVGELRGARGILWVVTVWMLRTADDHYRFVTLKPARNSRR